MAHFTDEEVDKSVTIRCSNTHFNQITNLFRLKISKSKQFTLSFYHQKVFEIFLPLGVQHIDNKALHRVD